MKKRTLATIVATLMVATMLTACDNKTTENPAPTISAGVEETTPTSEVTEEPTKDPVDIVYDGTLITAENIYTGKIPTAVFDYTYNGETRNILADFHVDLYFDSTDCTWPLIDMTDVDTALAGCRTLFGEPYEEDGDFYTFYTTYSIPGVEYDVAYFVVWFNGISGIISIEYYSVNLDDTTVEVPTVNTQAVDTSTLVVDIDKLNFTARGVAYNIVTNPCTVDRGEVVASDVFTNVHCGLAQIKWGTLDAATAAPEDYIGHISTILGEPILTDGYDGATWVLSDNAVLVLSFTAPPDPVAYLSVEFR